MKERRWRIKNGNAEKVAALANDLKIHPVLCNILVQRGIETFEQAKKFYSLHYPCPSSARDHANHLIGDERIFLPAQMFQLLFAPKYCKAPGEF